MPLFREASPLHAAAANRPGTPLRLPLSCCACACVCACVPRCSPRVRPQLSSARTSPWTRWRPAIRVTAVAAFRRAHVARAIRAEGEARFVGPPSRLRARPLYGSCHIHVSLVGKHPCVWRLGRTDVDGMLRGMVVVTVSCTRQGALLLHATLAPSCTCSPYLTSVYPKCKTLRIKSAVDRIWPWPWALGLGGPAVSLRYWVE